MTDQAAPSMETVEVKGHHLIETVKELIHEGNVRKIHIKDADGNSVLEMPVTVGVIGFLVSPTLTAIGTLGALSSDYSIDVERHRHDMDGLDITAVSPGGERESAQETRAQK